MSDKKFKECWGCIWNTCPPDEEIDLEIGCSKFLDRDEYVLISKKKLKELLPSLKIENKE